MAKGKATMKGKLDLSSVHAQATQSLLGDTIALTDEEWNLPSLLPGWTRAHLATHLARNADGIVRVIQQLAAGLPTSLYESEASYFEDIERGSERSALELQEDLDTSLSRLQGHWPDIANYPSDYQVKLTSTFSIPLDQLSLSHLNEVVLHHADFDLGFGWMDIDQSVARQLLVYNSEEMSDDPTYPAITIESTQLSVRLGTGEALLANGHESYLLCWLTGRLPEDQIKADWPKLPLR